MADELVFQIKADDDASAQLDKVQKEIKETGDATEKSGKQAEKSAKFTEKYGESLAAAGAAAAVLAAAAAATVVAAQEQREADNAVTSALERQGFTRAESMRALGNAQAEFAKNQAAGKIGDEAQELQFAKLIDATGDYGKSLELLNLSLDVAARNQLDLKAAGDAVQKAALGDVGALKALGFVTKDGEKAFALMTNETERSAAALALMSEKAGGARFDVDSLGQGTEQLKNDSGDVVQAVGELVIKLGELTGAMNLLVGDGTMIADFAADLTLGTKALGVWAENTSTAEKAATALAVPLAAMTGPFGFALLSVLMEDAAEDTAKLITEQEGLAKALEVSERNLRTARDLTPKLTDVSDSDRAAAMKIEQDKRDKIEAKRAAKAKVWADKRKKAQDAADAELLAAHNAYVAGIIERDTAISDARREALATELEEWSALHDKKIEITEIANDEQLALDIAASDARKEMIEAEGVVALRATSAMSEGLVAANDLIAIQNEGLAESISKWGELGSAIGNLAQPMSDLASAQDDHAAAASAGTAALSGLSAVGGAVAEIVADDVQEQAAWRGAFEAAAAVAATAAAFFNPLFAPAAVQHGIAAGMFGLVASGVTGGGGGGGGGGAGGGAGGGSGPPIPDIAAEREATATAIADKMGSQQNMQGITLILDLGRQNVIAAESDRFARLTTNAVTKGLRQVIGVGS